VFEVQLVGSHVCGVIAPIGSERERGREGGRNGGRKGRKTRVEDLALRPASGGVVGTAAGEEGGRGEEDV
jgi:hypothetical protein